MIEIPAVYFPEPPPAALLRRVAELVSAAASAEEDGVDYATPLAELSQRVGRDVPIQEISGYWRSASEEEVAEALLRPPPDRLPTPNNAQMVAMVERILAQAVGPDVTEHWTRILTRATGDEAFSDLIYWLEAGPSAEEIVAWARLRGQGMPVPLVQDGVMWRRERERGRLAGVNLLDWLKDRTAQEPAPGLPRMVERLGAGLSEDAGPDEVLAYFGKQKLPAEALRILAERVGYWVREQH